MSILSDTEQLTTGERPLYVQVRDIFMRRVLEGVWLPGQCLPSEMDLAADLGVSQGTVRKALDEMAAQNLVVRRQGRGTFIAQHDEKRILFQFFKLGPDRGPAMFPRSTIVATSKRPATGEEAAMLALIPFAEIIHIHRLRLLDGKKVISEHIVLPSGMFPGFSSVEIPNNLYKLYAVRYGVTVARAQEKLKAVILDTENAGFLDVAAGTPALHVDRVALALDGVPIEWRNSLCLTDDFHYTSELV